MADRLGWASESNTNQNKNKIMELTIEFIEKRIVDQNEYILRLNAQFGMNAIQKPRYNELYQSASAVERYWEQKLIEAKKKKIPTNDEVSKFAIDAVTNDGAIELTESGKLMAQLVELGAKWMRHQITGIPEYQHRIKNLFKKE